jgi:hypothetical protein
MELTQHPVLLVLLQFLVINEVILGTTALQAGKAHHFSIMHDTQQ